jgi:dual specificity phosphatase 12
MDEVIPGLWIGNLSSALNTQLLKSNNIYSILSAMRGRITINETFIRHQILLDDDEEADVLVHLLPSIHFIQAELDKRRGVLVHCQGGISRSATIVAAYLMHSKDLDPDSALKMIRRVRPYIDPNQGFLQQLEIFHQAHCKISRKDKPVRMYYMQKTAQDLLNGDGSQVETDMFAKFPGTPGAEPRRRIRCKMCRQELAAREHMLDHGQLGPPTPAVLTPASSRRPSAGQTSRRPSFPQAQSRGSASNDGKARRLSFLGLGGLGASLSMSALGSEHAIVDDDADHPSPITNRLSDVGRRLSGTTPPLPQISETLKETNATEPSYEDSAIEDDSEEGSSSYAASMQTRIETAKLLGRRLSNAVLTPVGDKKALEGSDGAPEKPQMTSLISPTDLAAQLYSNPKLAALRSSVGVGSSRINSSPVSPPILMNPKCSGYFLEPV